jgi:hypothetical protein
MVVTKAPRSAYAMQAISDLDEACALFNSAGKMGGRAAKALVCRFCTGRSYLF